MRNETLNDPCFQRAGALSEGWFLLSHRMTVWFRRAFIAIAAVFCMNPSAGSIEYHFEQLGITDGLSNNSITSIYQDHHGFLWFGTLDGLNRYDGYTFTTFRNDIQDSTSLGSNFILALYEDRSGMLWIGTQDAGLNRYDPATGKFRRFTHIPSDPGSLSHNMVESIFEDHSGILWFGTRDGLNRFDCKTGKFTRYYSSPADSSSLGDNHIGAMFEDADGGFWIGGGDYLHRFNADRGTFTRYRPHFPSRGEPFPGRFKTDRGALTRPRPNLPPSQRESFIESIVEEPRGTFWLSTRGSGLLKFDKATGQFTVFRHNPGNQGSLINDATGRLCLDRSGNLWIGTQNGLDLLNKGSGDFIHFRHKSEDMPGISSNSIWQLFLDRSGVLWIGTFHGGLNKLVTSGIPFVNFRVSPEKSGSSAPPAPPGPPGISGAPGPPETAGPPGAPGPPETAGFPGFNDITAIYESKNGDVWVGTAHGFNRFNIRTGQFTAYRKQPGGLDADSVNVIWEEPEGVFWIGTSGGGLNRFDSKSGRFRYYRASPDDPIALNSDWVYRITGDGAGGLLIGTRAGLCRLDPKSEHFQNLPEISGNVECTALYHKKNGAIWFGCNSGLTCYDPGGKKTVRFVSSAHDSTTLSSNSIRAINGDPSGNLWIGTAEGLNRFDRATGKFIRYTRPYDLPDESINDIEGDRYGNIWICTNAGISRLDIRSGRIQNYGFEGGRSTTVSGESCMLKTRDGDFLVGSKQGLITFRPESFQALGQAPPVKITGFRIFNREVKLDRPVWETKRITLSYRDAFFSFEFAALDYIAPNRNQYAYRLEGFDRDWIFSGARRYASYTNLHPGKYVFRVKAASAKGVWNEQGATIEVVVLTPFWETWWFRIICILLISGFFYGLHLLRKKQKKFLEGLVAKRTLELEEKKNQLEQSEQMYRSLVNTSDDAIMIIDTDGIIRMANPQVAEILEVKNAEKLIDRNFMDFLQPGGEERFREFAPRLLQTGILKNISLTIQLVSGAILPVEMNAHIIMDRGQPRIMSVFRDITERKRIEEERVERERMQAVLETAGGVCHELNQPLQVVAGYAEILELTNERDSSEQNDIVQRIRHEVKRMAEITRKLNNITAYRTKAYAGGTRIIDLSRSSGTGISTGDELGEKSENEEEQP